MAGWGNWLIQNRKEVMCMTLDFQSASKEFERVRSEAGVFAILKDGSLCGKITIRNIAKRGITHVALIIFSYVTHHDDIAAYEKVTGWGFNRQDFGIDRVLRNVQDELKNLLGIELTGNVMKTDRWIQDFERAGFKVIQAL